MRPQLKMKPLLARNCSASYLIPPDQGSQRSTLKISCSQKDLEKLSNLPPCKKSGKVHIIEGTILYFGLLLCGIVTGGILIQWEKYNVLNHKHARVKDYIHPMIFGRVIDIDQILFMLQKSVNKTKTESLTST